MVVKSNAPREEPFSVGCETVVLLSEKHALGLIHDVESMELAKRIPSETSAVVSESAYKWWSARFPNVLKRNWNCLHKGSRC
jgi:hypothetical protein